MQRFFTVLAATLALAIGSATVRAQDAGPRAGAGWNSPYALDLVRRASQRRQSQLADTTLHDYKALARGYLTFLGQLGEGMSEPPRVVQAAQVATEVYWRAPNVSKQRVVGTRDTTVLPTDNSFYRDRYGIVQNNFPNVIRFGEGRDVADVPHPLAPGGADLYDFAVRDSLEIRTGSGRIGVIEVQVRPRDATAPRFVGSLFIDRGDAQVVRMAFTFTRAAYIDKRNEDVSIVLENALVQGRYWLPRHQEVEVRRTGTWLDFPARGIIRGRWEIGDYAVNANLPPQTFAGFALEFAPPAERAKYAFGGRVLDSLPADVRMVTDEDVARVQAEARKLVQREVLARARGGALSARSISDFVRANRVEGVAVGTGYLWRMGSGVSLAARARYGIDDRDLKGRLTLQRQWASGGTLRGSGFHEFREAGDEPEVSLARNSLASQEFGSDYTDPYGVNGAALGVDAPATWLGIRPSFELGVESQRPLEVHASPFNGRFERTIPATRLRAYRATLGFDRATAPGPLGIDWRATLVGRASWWTGVASDPQCGGDGPCGTTGRAAGMLHVERAFGAARLVSHTTAAGVTGHRTDNLLADASAPPTVPPQDLVYLGGPVTGPGYDFHAFAGRIGASQRVEWRTPVPFPSIPLGQYGHAAATATLAPFAHVVYLAKPAPGISLARGGWYPSLGVGSYVLFDLLRFDVARGLRDGRWTFSVDVSRDFWRVL